MELLDAKWEARGAADEAEYAASDLRRVEAQLRNYEREIDECAKRVRRECDGSWAAAEGTTTTRAGGSSSEQ